MSALAANNAFAVELGKGEGYPNGLIGKVGKVRIDNVSRFTTRPSIGTAMPG